MRRSRPLSLVALLTMLAACVTVNVYFPAAAAERAADRFIRDVYGETGKETQPPPAGEQAEPLPPPAGEPQSGLIRLLDLLVPAALADTLDINISTPAINRLKAAMEARHRQLVPWYGKGAVGMTRDGLITLRDPSVVPLRDRNRVKQLIAQENRDRNALYAEVARANGHPEWEPEIRRVFAQRWVANAPSGWWYQDSRGAWQRK
ncbi:MAG: DUF1318 domain-containing protein [Gammaproteobacteria bacterium]|nr:MAG: DUF1318 domain-containing protein [Gammaproteobacteria bacterium]